MKRNHQQPTTSLPHVTDLAQAQRMIAETEQGIEVLIGRRDKVEPAVYLNYYREYHRLLRELRIREAELVERAG